VFRAGGRGPPGEQEGGVRGGIPGLVSFGTDAVAGLLNQDPGILGPGSGFERSKLLSAISVGRCE